MSVVRRLVASMVPPPGRVWIEAHEAELEFVDSRSARRKWARGYAKVVVVSFVNQVRRHPWTFLGGRLASVGALAAATVAILLASFLGVLLLVGDFLPSFVGALTALLLVQGALTWLSLTVGGRLFRRLVWIGGWISFVVGGVLTAWAGVMNLNPSVPDPEFGPFMIALVVGAHGVLVVLALSGRNSTSQ